MKKTLITILFVCLILVISCSDKKTKQEKEVGLRNALSYLSNVSSVAWYEIDGNDIYVGFWFLSDDWRMIIKGVALKGSNALNSRCQVFAMDADKEAWRAWRDWTPKPGFVSILDVNSREDMKAWMDGKRPEIDIYDGVCALKGKIIHENQKFYSN